MGLVFALVAVVLQDPIERLASPDPQTAARAVSELLATPEESRARLEAALPGLEGAVAERARAALDLLGWSPPTRLITARIEAATPEEAVRRLAEAAGAEIRFSRERYSNDDDSTVELALDRVPVAEALVLLCRGRALRPACEPDGLRIRQSWQGLIDGPYYAVGPYGVALSNMSVWRRLEFGGEDSTDASIQLLIVTDPALGQACSAQVEGLEVVDQDGRRIATARPPREEGPVYSDPPTGPG